MSRQQVIKRKSAEQEASEKKLNQAGGEQPQKKQKKQGGKGKNGKKGGGLTAPFRLLWETSKGLTIAVVVYGVIASVAPIAVLGALGRLIQKIHTAGQQELTSQLEADILDALVLAAIAYGVTLLLGPAQSVLSGTVKWRLVYRTQDRLMTAVSKPVGTAHLEDPKVLDDLSLAQGKMVNYYSADAPMTLVGVLVKQLNGILACAVLAWWHWWLGLAVLIAWVAILRPQLLLVRKQAAVFSTRAEVMRRAFYLEELASKPAAAKESRIFGLGDWLVDGFRAQWRRAMEGSWKVMRQQNRQIFVLAVCVLAVFAAVAGLMGNAAYDDDFGVGALVVLLSVFIASSALGVLSMEDLRLPWMLQGLPRMGGLESTLTDDAEAAAKETPGPDLPRSEVRFSGVRFSYPGADRDVFQGLDLTIPAGRSTAVVGVNGVGKTTLVKLLSRLHTPTGGSVTVDGTDLESYDPRAWQQKVAVVFQDFTRYPFSARENIAFGSPAHADDTEGLEWAAEQAGALPLIERLPQGWETVLSRQFGQGVELSGGEWQRVALARALFAVRHGARILVLDEPTAWLDARGEAEFFDRFLDITRNVTTLIISHRFSTVRKADQICVLDEGRVVEAGDHAALIARDGQYARLFALQAARFTEEDGNDRDS
ncbi:ABC transporter ATP-binding protein [Streptomyces sp. NPDC050759]|uniref:ABC transporter ATP-binding protein n=1 Tax=Streptomyces sp. NPDC050759 TaxID=3365635 RepID=UPI0037A4A89D